MNQRRVYAFVGILLLAATLAWGQAGDDLLPNPGFETVSAEGAIAQWTQPDYWSGELSSAEDDARTGERAAALGALERQGRHWGRIHSSTIPATVGLDYRFSVWAKGSGNLKLGVIHYRAEHPDLPRYETAWLETFV